MTIKSEREIKLMKEAGHINCLAHKEMEKFIKPEVTTFELDKKIHDFIVSHDAYPSCLGYEGFPASACICINDEVVHGIPSKTRKLKNGDIVKLDFTVRKAGYESDMTRTYLVGEVDARVKEMVVDTEKALYEGIKQVRPGARIGDVSYAIMSYAHSHGLSVVEELVGHGIGTNMHEEPDGHPSVPHPRRQPSRHRQRQLQRLRHLLGIALRHQEARVRRQGALPRRAAQRREQRL